MYCSTWLPYQLHYLPEFIPSHVHWISDAIQPSHPLLLPSPPALSLSKYQGLFQWIGSSHQVARVLELHLHHQSFQWIFRVDVFRIDWVDRLAVQGTLKSLLQHSNLKASILRHSAFFIVFYFVFKILVVAQSGSACESLVVGKPQLSATWMTSHGWEAWAVDGYRSSQGRIS